MLERLGARTREVRRPADLAGLDGLVIPGGESTTIDKLMAAYGLAEPIQALRRGRRRRLRHLRRPHHAWPATPSRATPPTLGLMDIVARRNAFGRQVRSFEADLEVARARRRRRCAPSSSARRGSRAPARASRSSPRYQGHIVAAREGRRARHGVPPGAHRRHASARAVHRHDPPPAGAADEPEGAAQPRDAGEPGRAAAAAGNR